MDRRSFLKLAGPAAMGALMGETRAWDLTLFLCGDVMMGRGIDQVLPHPVDPRLYEGWAKSALRYVELAESRNGPIPRPVGFPYVWGDALEVLEQVAPQVRIINLETAVTADGEPWPRKGIHYRMHPGNVECLTAAGSPCCVLANNHVLDWGRTGLAETLVALARAGLPTCGAGGDAEQAAVPAVLPISGGGRVLVFALGHESSGIPATWAAGVGRSGVNLLRDLSENSVARVAAGVRSFRRPGDIAVASIHWGGNWGYDVPGEQRRFAHGLVDRAGIDVVHGHSSHHPKGVEVYRDRPILYGCGDFINDYEGIGGYEEFRGELTLMYFPCLDRQSGRLRSLEMVPMRVRRFRLQRASAAEAGWLARTLDRESRALGCRVTLGADERLSLK